MLLANFFLNDIKKQNICAGLYFLTFALNRIDFYFSVKNSIYLFTMKYANSRGSEFCLPRSEWLPSKAVIERKWGSWITSPLPETLFIIHYMFKKDLFHFKTWLLSSVLSGYSNTVIPWYLRWLRFQDPKRKKKDSRTPVDTKSHGDSSLLCKMVSYSRPSIARSFSNRGWIPRCRTWSRPTVYL